jgi:hypothetical protein
MKCPRLGVLERKEVYSTHRFGGSKSKQQGTGSGKILLGCIPS